MVAQEAMAAAALKRQSLLGGLKRGSLLKAFTRASFTTVDGDNDADIAGNCGANERRDSSNSKMLHLWRRRRKAAQPRMSQAGFLGGFLFAMGTRSSTSDARAAGEAGSVNGADGPSSPSRKLKSAIHERAMGVVHGGGADAVVDFESSEALLFRSMIRGLGEVRVLARQLWEAAGLDEESGMTAMSRRAYMDYHLSCFLFLEGKGEAYRYGKISLSEMLEANQCAQDDWRSDSGGEALLTFDGFISSVFELADLRVHESYHNY